LIAVETDPSVPVLQPNITFESNQLVVTSIRTARDSAGYIVRLYNPASCPGNGMIRLKDSTAYSIRFCDSMGNPSGKAENTIELQGYGVATLRISSLADPSN
jgi:alpha-mannosidase